MKKRKNLLAVTAILVACLVCLSDSSIEARAAKTAKPKLNRTKVTLTIGKTTTLKVKNSKKKFKWSTTNKKVATVSKKGVVKAVKKGTAKVVAKYGKTKLVCKVTVKPIPTVKPEPVTASISSQVADFSVSMFQKATKQSLQDQENTMISPYSISLAMLMMANGAKNDTLTQLEQAMCGSYNMDAMHSYMSNLTKALTSEKDGGTALHSANSIWMNQENGSLKESFVETNKTLYQAIANDRIFDDDTCKEINEWIANNTNNMIQNPISHLEKEDTAILVNALAFEGSWQEKYEKSQIKENQTFTKEDGTKENVTMMYETFKNNYFEDTNLSGFVKNYNDGYAFMAILPKEGVTVEQCVASLTGKKLIQYYKNHEKSPDGYEYIVHTKLPQFDFDYEDAAVVDALKEMGVCDAFDEQRADFSELATLNLPTSNLYIGDILHKSHIELDENGTRAAAITIVISKVTTLPSGRLTPITKQVYLDRPFVFVIMDCKNNTPLFIGVVHSPLSRSNS